jgi:hypothetical protein
MTSEIMAETGFLASRNGGSGSTSNPVTIIVSIAIFIAIVVAVLFMKPRRWLSLEPPSGTPRRHRPDDQSLVLL